MAFFVFTIDLYIVLKTSFFTKNNARKLVKKQDFKLIDEFELLRNVLSIFYR